MKSILVTLLLLSAPAFACDFEAASVAAKAILLHKYGEDSTVYISPQGDNSSAGFRYIYAAIPDHPSIIPEMGEIHLVDDGKGGCGIGTFHARPASKIEDN